MSRIRGPAIDSEAFRVEGHCCGIRIPALKELDDEGLQFEIPDELKTELFESGESTPEGRPESPA